MCDHNEVNIYGFVRYQQTQLSPAEYVEVIECCDCGTELDSAQIPLGAVIHGMRDNTQPEPKPNDYD